MSDNKPLDIACIFCESPVEIKQGVAVCPTCSSSFKIDDRGECVYVDIGNPKLPLHGTFCPVCGLVQGETTEQCYNCATKLVGRTQ